MSNRGLRESFGRCGREFAINKFGLDVVIKDTLSVYKETLSHDYK
jgi:hypothetical protein